MIGRHLLSKGFFIYALSLFLARVAFAQLPLECGALANNYGPFDYTNPQHKLHKLGIVEKAHFTRNIEQLIGGKSSTLEGDLDYTLRAFPNHHRALASFSNLNRIRQRSNPDYRTGYFTLECYFLRAIANAPEDPVVYLLYGIFHDRLKQSGKAESNYLKSIDLDPESAGAHYNLGLLYFRLAKYEESLEHAKVAYDRKYPLPGLMKKLKKSGHWN